MTRDLLSEPAVSAPADDLDDANAQDNLEFALRSASRYITQQFERALVPMGLTAPQFTILRHLSGRGPMTMVELAHVVMIERTTVVRAVQVLEKDGLVVSQLESGRSRTLRLSLSELGETRLVQARAIWRDLQRHFEARFGVDRAARLRSELFSMTGREAGGPTGKAVDAVAESERK